MELLEEVKKFRHVLQKREFFLEEPVEIVSTRVLKPGRGYRQPRAQRLSAFKG